MSLGLLTNFGMYKYVISLLLFITIFLYQCQIEQYFCRATCRQMGKYSRSSFMQIKPSCPHSGGRKVILLSLTLLTFLRVYAMVKV